MPKPIIEIENIGKRYRIGAHKEPYLSLRDEIMKKISPARRRAWAQAGDFWALKDVSFSVQEGEAVAIIGRNGAGKSTLLKILSRITPPTEGRITMRGRVSSLLEVGTGFHPELTGRENIYLNGAILGMTRGEIRRKFDEIVAFAEVDKFLDTPVKRFSSGMYVRLAFAVAAHLEPEILIVDEVLAVGDAQFQKKCLGKMGEVAKEGRTVMFVSHNSAAVQSLCGAAYLLTAGRVASHGAVRDVVSKYLQDFTALAETVPLHERTDRTGDGRARLTSISIDNYDGRRPICCGDRLRIRLGYAAETPLLQARFLLKIGDPYNRPVLYLDSATMPQSPDTLPACGHITCITDPINLVPDTYTLNATLLVGGTVADKIKPLCTFEVDVDDFYGTGKLPSPLETLCLLKHQWALLEGFSSEVSNDCYNTLEPSPVPEAQASR